MSKERISATIDRDVAEYVARDDVNVSGLVNKLLKHHMSGATGREQMLEMRVDQVQEDIREMEGRLENKRAELTRLQNELEKIDIQTENAVEEAAEKLTRLDFKNQSMKVDYYTDKTGLSVSELREAVEEQWSP